MSGGGRSKPSALAEALARISEADEAKLELEREANQVERDRVGALVRDQKRINLIRDLRLVARTFEQENRGLREALADLTRLAAAKPSATKIKPRTRKEIATGRPRAVPVLLVSDLHLEEEVKPKTVGGFNTFNLEIASASCDRLFRRWVERVEILRSSAIVKEAVIWLGGDHVSNVLHEESFEINQLSPIEALEFAFEHLTRGIDYALARGDFGRIIIPTSHGNHGRINTYAKSKIASEAVNNHEWGLYVRLARHYAAEKRVAFIVAGGYLNWLRLGDAAIRFHHGHQIKGAGGSKLGAKLTRCAERWDLEPPPGEAEPAAADVTCSGHFHNYLLSPGAVGNGSLIGHNAFGHWIGAPAREPCQASFTVYPDNPTGYRVADHFPILVR